jgi:hypothetical protein
MKFLCVSDEVDPRVYSASIKERFGEVDAVLCAGDLPLDYLEFIVSSLNRPLYFVFGNHELGDFRFFSRRGGVSGAELNLRRYFSPGEGAGAVHIGGKVVREGGLLFAGLGGSMRYNGGENQLSEGQMSRAILSLAPRLFLNRLRYGRYLDVLLTHAPPAGIHDRDDPCHRGFAAFLWFMRVFKPRCLIHGHTHLYGEAAQKTRYHSTMVINAFRHAVVDFNGGGSEDADGKPGCRASGA